MIEKRLAAFLKLGIFLEDFLSDRKNTAYQSKYEELDAIVEKCFSYNGWFTQQNVLKALQGIGFMLNEKNLRAFASEIKEPQQVKTVTVIMAGNIPAVGFHDFMCVLLSGHKILVKPSSDDTFLIPFLANFLVEEEPLLKNKIEFAEGRLQNFDAVIATGSNNSALYFEKYFGKYPHIIRKNRTSVAVLSGNETTEELEQIGHDIFDYYGLGCRNVSKIFVPKNYVLDTFFEGIFSFKHVINNNKYGNNYEYNRAIYLLNQDKFLDNNFLLIKQNESLHSPVGVLFYEEYEDLKTISSKIKSMENELQCVVSKLPLQSNTVTFGQTQSPTIFDFADGVNTLSFLNKLS